MSTLVLVGSGEFTPPMEPVDSYLLGLLRPKAKVAILPTAAGREADYHKWIDKGIKHFTKLGASVYGVPIIDLASVNKANLAKLKMADFIYMSGGDPAYLWSVITNSPIKDLLTRRLAEKDFILAGCSAGAMVMGEHIPEKIHSMYGNYQSTQWIKTLGLVTYSVLPHYDYLLKKQKRVLKRVLANIPLPAKEGLIGIDENTAVIMGSPWQIMGQGGLHFIYPNQPTQSNTRQVA